MVDASGNPTDIEAFFAGLNPPLPPPALTPPVPVAGGSNTVQGGPGHVSGDDAEVALDIDVVGSVAVGGTVAVYFIGNNTETGWVSAITTAISPGAGQPSPSVITISWAWREDELERVAAGRDQLLLPVGGGQRRHGVRRDGRHGVEGNGRPVRRPCPCLLPGV